MEEDNRNFLIVFNGGEMMKKKILAVDNHPVVLKFMSQLLEKEGHQALTASLISSCPIWVEEKPTTGSGRFLRR
ncbi:MAG: response regulator [Syntrophaceae bacterium]|nr:response regulator [Syntrophaceae bacterium]